MRIHLPDVNILIALHDTNHPGHQAAQIWLTNQGQQGWATCPLTENGFIRVFAQTTAPVVPNRLAAAFLLLNNMLTVYAATHRFWPDSVSLRDTTLFDQAAIAGHRQLTDIYLLGLCQQMGGTLVTLDDKISLAAIVNPHPDLLLKL